MCVCVTCMCMYACVEAVKLHGSFVWAYVRVCNMYVHVCVCGSCEAALLVWTVNVSFEKLLQLSSEQLVYRLWDTSGSHFCVFDRRESQCTRSKRSPRKCFQPVYVQIADWAETGIYGTHLQTLSSRLSKDCTRIVATLPYDKLTFTLTQKQGQYKDHIYVTLQ